MSEIKSEIKITVHNYHIVPKARPRVTKNGTHMPKKYMDCIMTIKTYGMRACKLDKMLTGNMGMEIVFNRKGSGDLDNLAGTVMDALQGIVYDNDSKITKLTCEKIQSKIEKTEIRIYER